MNIRIAGGTLEEVCHSRLSIITCIIVRVIRIFVQKAVPYKAYVAPISFGVSEAKGAHYLSKWSTCVSWDQSISCDTVGPYGFYNAIDVNVSGRHLQASHTSG